MSVSAKTSPDITLEWDNKYDRFLDEAADLIVAHWGEVGSFRPHLELRPHHEAYRKAEAGGNLHILTARYCGILVGYFFIVLSRHIRDSTKLMVTDDVIYVRPGYRRYGIGSMLIREGLRKAQELGATIVMFREKARRKGGGYLRRFGMEPHEIVYAKVLK